MAPHPRVSGASYGTGAGLRAGRVIAWGGGNSASMHHKFPDILAHVSNSETLYAGEVIGSGTVGTGSGNEMGRYLNSGDVVELEIEKIGVLRNTVVKG